MKKLFSTLTMAAILATMVSCDAFNSLLKPSKTSLGDPYELIVTAPADEWNSALGDTLRSVFGWHTSRYEVSGGQVPYLNEQQPLFDMLFVPPSGYTAMVPKHCNILKVNIDPAFSQTAAEVGYDLMSNPQIVVTLNAPNATDATQYISDHRQEMVYIFEKAERDRDLKYNSQYNQADVEKAIKSRFGCDITLPKGYFVADSTDNFIWARFDLPTQTLGLLVYSYPRTKNWSARESIIAQRNKFAALVPGELEGSHMTTFETIEPSYETFRQEGRAWVEMRGFWELTGDFMGGSFINYTTVNTQTDMVVGFDLFLYAPDTKKRNIMRGLEHIFYSISFPTEPTAPQVENN